MRDLQKGLNAEVLSGEAHLDALVGDYLIAAMHVDNFLDYLAKDQLIVTPGDTHYFRFVAPSSGWYTMRTESVGGGVLDTQGYLLSSTGLTLQVDDDLLSPFQLPNAFPYESPG